MNELHNPIVVKTATACVKQLMPLVKERISLLQTEHNFYGDYSDDQIEDMLNRGLKSSEPTFEILFFPNLGISSKI